MSLRRTPTSVSGLTGVMQVCISAAGSTFALLNDGTVKAWGSSSSFSALGLGSPAEQRTPTTVPDLKLFSAPVCSINSPSQDSVFSEADDAFVPQISVSDVDNDFLTCRYYIDSETLPRDTKTVADTITAKTISFSALNMGTLTDGNHTIKYTVSNERSATLTYTVSFKVDKSAPTLGTVTVTSAINSATVNGSANDSISGLAGSPYRYTLGTTATSWVTGTTKTFENLMPDTQYAVKFEAQDKKGHIASKSQNTLTKAAVPVLSVSNAASYSLNVVTTDNNPSTTQYQISLNNGYQYVTQEGNLTSTPVWIILSSKKITVSSLNPSTTYTFQAKARNAENIETTMSPSVSGTTLIKPPAAPVNLIATATDKQITVSWDAVGTATEYEILADGKSVVVGTNLAYTHTQLSPGTPHTYQVRARNAGGPGAWSAQITKSTLPTLPNIPVNVVAVPQSTSITVTWSNVPMATGYDIEVDGALVANGPTTNYIHSSLTPGTFHSYRVRSINPGGKSDWSVTVNATTTSESSPVPANLAATPSGNEISLAWDAVNGATGYEIEVDEVRIDNNTRTTYIHKNLAPASQHMYRVRSQKNNVISDWSAAVIAETLSNVFGTPTGLKADANDVSITLSWDAVSDAIGYDVEADGGIIDNGTETSAIITGLEPAKPHTYRVRAKSTSQTSEWSEPLQVNTFDLPTPTIISATSTETEIGIIWENPAATSQNSTKTLLRVPNENESTMDTSNGDQLINTTGASAEFTLNSAAGSSLQSDSTMSDPVMYELEADGIIIPDISGNSYVYGGLASGTQHVFRVRAKNENGISNWSIPVTKSTTFNQSNAPTGLFAVLKSSSAIIMWQKMDSAVSYDIDVDGTLIENITDTKYEHTGLLPGSKHTYKVRANNDTGDSNWTEELNILTKPEGPATPTNLTASSTTSKIIISWDQVNGANEYEIEADGVVIPFGNGTSYQQSSLVPDTQHSYRVRSKNSAGFSPWSEPVSTKTKSSTMTYVVECVQDEEFDLVFSASNIQDVGQYTFNVNYDPGKLEAVDLCSITSKTDNAAGLVIGTDIQIVQFTPGTIVFKKTGSAQSYQAWSGTVNTIRFRSMTDGQSDVIYSFQ